MTPTADAITQALHAEGFMTNGAVITIDEEERFQAFATAVFRIRLTYRIMGSAPPPETLICKIYGPEWYERGGLQDLLFFRRIAPALEPPIAPTLYGVIHDPAARTCVLLIEDLASSYRQLQSSSAEEWLDAIVDALADLHARWWDAPMLGTQELLTPEDTVMRMAQALPVQGLRANVASARAAISQFRARFGPELTANESDLLTLLDQRWAAPFIERTAGDHNMTLLHGDFHLLGNVFIPKQPATVPTLKAIDWGQVKRGLGPHDLMYALLSVEAPDRRSRDLALLQRYHHRLLHRGIQHYAWEQCLWDYRFSLLTNLFQSVFQGSLHWFRRTHDVVDVWQATQLLESPPSPI